MSSAAESYISISPTDPDTPDEIPSGSGEQINFTDESLGFNIATTKSAHIRPDRMTQDISVTGAEVSGSVNAELHFSQDREDSLLAAALWGEWEGFYTDNSVITPAEGVVIEGATIDFGALASPPDNILPGIGIIISGSIEGNDGIYTLVGKDTSVGPDAYFITPVPLDEVLSLGATIYSEFLRNASLRRPFFIERGHMDVDEYFQFKGMYLNTMEQEYNQQDLVKVGFSFLGMGADISQTPSHDTYFPPSKNEIFSVATSLPSIRFNNDEVDKCLVQSFTLNVENNTSQKTAAGVLGSCGVTPHRFEATGSMSMYFNNSIMHRKLISEDEFAFGWTLQDSRGRGYTYNMQRCRLIESNINVSGIDDDVLDAAQYEALVDPDSSAALIISRLDNVDGVYDLCVGTDASEYGFLADSFGSLSPNFTDSGHVIDYLLVDSSDTVSLGLADGEHPDDIDHLWLKSGNHTLLLEWDGIVEEYIGASTGIFNSMVDAVDTCIQINVISTPILHPTLKSFYSDSGTDEIVPLQLGVGDITVVRDNDQYTYDVENHVWEKFPAGTPAILGRAVTNLLQHSRDISNTVYTLSGNASVDGTDTLNLPDELDSIQQDTLGYEGDFTLSAVLSGSGTVSLRIEYASSGTSDYLQATLTSTPTRHSLTVNNPQYSSIRSFVVRRVGDTAEQVIVTDIQLEKTSKPGERIETTDTSVRKLYSTTNGNVVEVDGSITENRGTELENWGLRLEAEKTTRLQWNRDLSQGVWGGVAQVLLEATGIDGVGNSASILTDSSDTVVEYKLQTISIADNDDIITTRLFVKKDQENTVLRRINLALEGGSERVRSSYLINTSTGELTPIFAAGIYDAEIIDRTDWWELLLSIQNNSSGNIECELGIHPASSDDGVSTDGTLQGSMTVDCAQLHTGMPISAIIDTSPIFTQATEITVPNQETGYSTLNHKQSNGLFYIEVIPTTTGNLTVVNMGGVANSIMLLTGGNLRSSDSNDTQAFITHAIGVNGVNKIAVVYSAEEGSFRCVSRGLAGTSFAYSGEFDISKGILGIMTAYSRRLSIRRFTVERGGTYQDLTDRALALTS